MKVLLKWKTVWQLQDIEKLHGQKWKIASQIYEQTLIIFMSGHVAVENLANMTKWFFWQGKKEESSSKLIIPGRENVCGTEHHLYYKEMQQSKKALWASKPSYAHGKH